mmetsp:Transcript_2402/g.5676  ORF Transcript_2402/g.5676 Transcript_2402/m.5676 type:complete len:322 (-) Transcript_2402:676-1641(-)
MSGHRRNHAAGSIGPKVNRSAEIPAGVADAARLRADHHGLVVRLRERVDQLKLKVPQQHRPDGFYLQVGEVGSHAAVAPATKADEAEAALVLLAPGSKAVRVVLRRVPEDAREAVLVRRGRRQHVALGDGVRPPRRGRHVKGLVRLAEQHHERRLQAQRLRHVAVQDVHLVQDLHVEPLAVLRDDGPLLLERGLQADLWVVDHVQPRPCRGDGRGVLPREEHSDEHPRDLIVGHRAAVLVARVDERLQHVGLLRAVLAAVLNDLGEDLCELRPRPVAALMRRDREVGEDHADGLHAEVEVVEQVLHLGKHVLPHLAAEEGP